MGVEQEYIDELVHPAPRAEYAPYDTTRVDTSLYSSVDPKELVQLCAVDTELFCKVFFSRAFRQQSPIFAEEFWNALEGPERLVNAQMFRGASKTTRCRAYTLKRICYGLAHTVLFVAKSEKDALRSGAWIKRQVLYNRPLAQLFGLRQGGKWTDEEFEIIHDVDEFPIWIICAGITGSIRGINRDDFRPDLIILDDIHDEENSATEEQRDKIRRLVFGALLESLAPKSEAPHAKMVNLATPLQPGDITMQALKKGSGWKNIVIPCWTHATEGLPTHLQQSVWPERWSSAVLREEKEGAAARNMLSTWMREKALKLVAPEASAFRSSWLQHYSVLPEDIATFLAIDPVPPPSKHALEKGILKTDFEAIGVVGIYRSDYYILELSAKRGHDPSWTTAEFFRLALKWRPQRCFVEATAYQRTLAWILRQEMRRRAQYFAIEEIIDQRSKYNRIIDGLNGVSSEGHLYIPEDVRNLPAVSEEVRDAWAMFLEQFEMYGNPGLPNDDVIECVAVAVAGAAGRFDQGEGDEFDLEEEAKRYPKLVWNRGAP